MIIGAGFLLFALIDGAFKIFTVEELRSKPEYFKKAGMWSFPLETFEAEKDICPRNTIFRLLREEIGIPSENIDGIGFSKQGLNLIPGRTDVVTFYGFGIANNPSGVFVPEDNDIIFVGWKTIEELLSHDVRVEVEPILRHFEANYMRKLKT